MKLIKQSVFFVSLFIFSGVGISLHAAWSPPVQISSGPSSLNPTATPLVIDSNSCALVGWLNGDIGVAQMLFSSSLLLQSDTWSTPELIYANNIPGLFPSFPAMSLYDWNKEIATFGVLDTITSSIVVESIRRLASDPWTTPIEMMINGIPQAGAVVSDDLGNVAAFLALTSTNMPPFDLTFIQLPLYSSSWTTPIVFAQETGTTPVGDISIHAGKGILAWKVSTPSLQLQTSAFNFLTQTPEAMMNVPLPAMTLDILGIDVVVDEQGESILIYIVQTGSGTALYVSSLFGSQTAWTSPILVSDPANGVVSASVAVDASGNATIIWAESIGMTQQFIRVASLPCGGALGPITDLTDRTNMNASVNNQTPKVVMDHFGNAAVIWGIVYGSDPYIQVSSKATGQDWTAIETLSTSGANPVIALSNQGTAVAAWIDSVNSTLQGSRNLYLFTLLSPSYFIGTVEKNEFLTQKTYFLDMKWDPTLAPNISYYQIFKNGQLLATIPGNGPFDFLQHIGSKKVNDSYVLIATASNGNKSAPVPIVIQPK